LKEPCFVLLFLTPSPPHIALLCARYLSVNKCPGGYGYFQHQVGDVRYYVLYICKGC
jgi:hypothetical protein